ncbi:MAG TPA: 4Fe-4S binding protein [Clostridiales bacterium]|jgi:aryl-alcohol dehydrogenase-like predicted oxidoreductase|nr:4Fe-4S binding protein [Clostridiales bacterium]
MNYRALGNTGIVVSRICFGTLTISPLQRNLSLKEGCRVLDRAVDQGINFIDTADLYRTYPYIREALKRKPDLIVSTKSYAYDKKTAQETLTRALKETGRDYVDLFLLHEQEGPLTLKGHEEALQFFLRQKEKGLIRAVGISTHFVAAVKAAAKISEIDVIHPILNFRGMGIVDGTLTEMEQAVATAYKAGKGIYVMKALGGGHLLKNFEKALDYILDFPYTHSIALGMQRPEEVDANVEYFAKRDISEQLRRQLKQYKRELIVEYWCQGCGNCIQRCNQSALHLKDGKAMVDQDKCVLCGYCGTVCKELAIKVI